jgi:hypothetical protein
LVWLGPTGYGDILGLLKWKTVIAHTTKKNRKDFDDRGKNEYFVIQGDQGPML